MRVLCVLCFSMACILPCGGCGALGLWGCGAVGWEGGRAGGAKRRRKVGRFEIMTKNKQGRSTRGRIVGSALASVNARKLS